MVKETADLGDELQSAKNTDHGLIYILGLRMHRGFVLRQKKASWKNEKEKEKELKSGKKGKKKKGKKKTIVRHMVKEITKKESCAKFFGNIIANIETKCQILTRMVE